jgi:hypothetical protein
MPEVTTTRQVILEITPFSRQKTTNEENFFIMTPKKSTVFVAHYAIASIEQVSFVAKAAEGEDKDKYFTLTLLDGRQFYINAADVTLLTG